MTQSVVVEIRTVGQWNSLDSTGLLALQAGIRGNSCAVAIPSRGSSLAVGACVASVSPRLELAVVCLCEVAQTIGGHALVMCLSGANINAGRTRQRCGAILAKNLATDVVSVLAVYPDLTADDHAGGGGQHNDLRIVQVLVLGVTGALRENNLCLGEVVPTSHAMVSISWIAVPVTATTSSY